MNSVLIYFIFLITQAFFKMLELRPAGPGAFCNSVLAIWTWVSSQFCWPLKPADALAGIVLQPFLSMCIVPFSQFSRFLFHLPHLHLPLGALLHLSSNTWHHCLVPGKFPLSKWTFLQRRMVLSFIRAAIQSKCWFRLTLLLSLVNWW